MCVCEDADFPKSEKYLKFETLLVPHTLDKGYLTCASVTLCTHKYSTCLTVRPPVLFIAIYGYTTSQGHEPPLIYISRHLQH